MKCKIHQKPFEKLNIRLSIRSCVFIHQHFVLRAVGSAQGSRVPGLSAAEGIENRFVEFDPFIINSRYRCLLRFSVAVVVIGSLYF